MKIIRSIALLTIMMIGMINLTGCSRVEPNHEAVKMINWGKNGIEDLVEVKGLVPLNPFTGEKLYQVPMWETSGGFDNGDILAKDAGEFSISPRYQYSPMRSKGKHIVYNFKDISGNENHISLDEVELKILNVVVFNAYREIARSYTTDELMSNLQGYEEKVEKRLKEEFEEKGFVLLSLTSSLDPPDSMKKAVEARNESIQNARKAENDLEIARMEQQKALIERETNRIRSQGLTPQILTSQWIDAINDNDKIIITDGNTPVMISK